MSDEGITFGEDVDFEERQQGNDGGFYSGAYELIPGPKGDPGPIGPTGPAGPGWEIILPAGFTAYYTGHIPPLDVPEWGPAGATGMHSMSSGVDGSISMRREGRTARFSAGTGIDCYPPIDIGSTLFTGIPVGFEPEEDAYFLVATMHPGQDLTEPVKPAIVKFDAASSSCIWLTGGYSVAANAHEVIGGDVLLLGWEGITYSCPEAHA